METLKIESVSGVIACHQSSGSGQPIVLIHGNSASSRAFAHQIDGPLGEKYRLIAIDLPGHGASANAADPSIYTIPGYARVLRDVVRKLDVEQAVFVGWSLGGHIVLEAAPDLPQAPGFVIFGTPPLADPRAMELAFLPHPAMKYTFAHTLNEQEARAYVAAGLRPGITDLPPTMVADVMLADGRARAQLAASLQDTIRDQADVVFKLKQPLAVLHGAQEQLVNYAYFATLKMPTLWRDAVQIIPDAGHAPQWEQPAAFNALLDTFVAESR